MHSLVVVLLLLSSAVSADTISGKPTITDGDTFRFKSGIRIRLFGVDTPEKSQKCEAKGACYPCGQEATKFVQNFIGKSELVCELTGDKTFDRYVASCSVGGKDLGEALIANGWGFPYLEFLEKSRLEAPYTAAARQAQSRAAGMHRGRFIPPADWRNHKMRLECER
jgi:endonuclease YncB( thermonuclease family)